MSALLPGELLPGVRRTPEGGLVLRPDTEAESDARLDLESTVNIEARLTQLRHLLPSFDGHTREVMVNSIVAFEAALVRRGAV